MRDAFTGMAYDSGDTLNYPEDVEGVTKLQNITRGTGLEDTLIRALRTS